MSDIGQTGGEEGDTVQEEFSRSGPATRALLSDIEMPDENGYAFIGRVRALAPEEGGMVPAVAMTAHGSREDGDRALAAGFQSHLPKPFQPADLFALVGELAGRGVPTAS